MEKITDLSQLDLTKQYTYADYLTWWFDERVELFKGYIKKMAAPQERHQRVSGNLYYKVRHYLNNQPCQVRVAPYDVRLQRSMDNTKITTVVQPDICIICNPEIIDERGCNGTPDMIIEIVSPNNAKRDVKDKYELYEEAGVKEYWIVFPNDKMIDVFVLIANKFQLLKKYVDDDIITVNTIKDLNINLTEIFNYVID